MPTPSGYILSEKDIALLRELNYTFKRLQHFVNVKGISDFVFDIDDNSATSQIYIAKTPQGGIPALTVAASTGIGDTPGSAVCTLLRKSRGVATTDTMPHSRQETVLNLSTTAIPGEQWILIIRDKHGSWYALNVDAGQAGTVFGPGWTAGLSNEDCLYLTVSSAVGKCSTIDTSQAFRLVSSDAIIWEGVKDFIYSGGSGPVIFTRPDCQALPTLQIDGYCLIWDKAGLDENGVCYIEYKGGTSLCSDVPGTGSGTGGSRGVCCSNTFTVRLTCACPDYPTITACDCSNPMPETVCATVTNGTGSHSCINGSYNLTAVSNGWHVLNLPYPCPTESGTGQLAFTCPGGFTPFVVGFTASGFTISVTATTIYTSGCNLPFFHVYDVSTSDTAANSGTFRVMFTPGPC